VYANHSIEVSYSPLLEAYSNPGETLDQFKARVTQTARELRDKAIEDLRAKVAKAASLWKTRSPRPWLRSMRRRPRPAVPSSPPP